MAEKIISVADKETLNNVKSILENDTYGLEAIRGMVANQESLDTINALLKDSGYGLSAIKSAISNSGGQIIHIGKDPLTTHSIAIGVTRKVSTISYDFIDGHAVVFNDEIHIVGGVTSGSSLTKNHYKWNGSSWSSVSTLPMAIHGSPVVVWGTSIHIFYGTSHYKWNGSSWSSVSTIPFSVSDTSSVVVFGKEIHLLQEQRHYKWNGSAWSSVSTIPFSFSGGCAVVFNDELHILGGYATGRYHYKWNGSAWSSVSVLPYKFYRGSAVVFNDEIHILGSTFDTTGSADYTWANSHYKWNGSSWSSVNDLPYYVRNGSAVVFNDEIHILGGYCTQTSSSTGYVYTNHYTVESAVHSYCFSCKLEKGSVITLRNIWANYPYIISGLSKTSDTDFVYLTCTESGLCRFLMPYDDTDFPYSIQ